MRKLEQQVGSAHNLVAFEAAARHLSFSRAAEELSVTQPAVSQSVRRLEEVLGARLFLRLHRSLALTDAGRRLAEELGDAFDRIQSVARQIGREAAQGHVTMLVSTAFATWWLVPRLSAFHRLHPDIDLRLETVDRDIDIARQATTLAVRRGDGAWPSYAAALIAPERLTAVASPDLLQRYGMPETPADLAALPKIHLDEPHRFRPGWPDFLAAAGLSWTDRGDGLRLNDYALVMQAAQAGEGVALGWAHICDRPVRQGVLRQVGPWSWTTGAGFHLVWSEPEVLTPQTRIVRDWVLEAARG